MSAVVPAQGPPAEPTPPAPWLRTADLVLRAVAGVLAVAGALLTGLVELMLAGVRVGGHLVGVAVPVVVVANVALSWFAHRAVGAGWAVALPAVPWFGLMVVAAVRTDEGDLLLAGDNWVGLAMIVAGAMTFAVMTFRLVLAPAATRSG
ncbi:hypothetical protein [Micromonospora echinofusca]|uniref:SPW repeat-containing protein n=1 Tax=Micromonospora echinofusca TaxID=47858 RepID=A0ABS3VNH0_MICEH|nr:hypothetical protein [Micromonospora echinofusca]MBO4206087.1 hypothetical protein [Micromonospora echinofusca]